MFSMFFNNDYWINSIVYDLKLKLLVIVYNYFGYVSGKSFHYYNIILAIVCWSVK